MSVVVPVAEEEDVAVEVAVEEEVEDIVIEPVAVAEEEAVEVEVEERVGSPVLRAEPVVMAEEVEEAVTVPLVEGLEAVVSLVVEEVVGEALALVVATLEAVWTPETGTPLVAEPRGDTDVVWVVVEEVEREPVAVPLPALLVAAAEAVGVEVDTMDALTKEAGAEGEELTLPVKESVYVRDGVAEREGLEAL